VGLNPKSRSTELRSVVLSNEMRVMAALVKGASAALLP